MIKPVTSQLQEETVPPSSAEVFPLTFHLSSSLFQPLIVSHWQAVFFYWFTNSPWNTPVIWFPCRLQLGSILYSLTSPHPTSSSTRTRMRTPPTTITLLIRSYALCACALSQSSYNPSPPPRPPSVFCLVGLSSTSAAALSAAEDYKRWRAERGFVNGRRDVCQLTDQRAVGTSADAPPLPPHTHSTRAAPPSPHPTYPGSSSPSPGQHASPCRWMEVW